MTGKIIRRATALLLIATFLGVSSVFAQTIINEGKGFGNIKIGKSTMKDVIAIYGEGYKLIDHNKYSYEMAYKNLGLSFYACQADKKEEIFTVVFTSPFPATTSKGVVLGTSRLGDVTRLYGRPGKKVNSDSDQKGIYFFVAEDDDDDSGEAYKPEIFITGSAEEAAYNAKIIIRIELVEKSGVRQCEFD